MIVVDANIVAYWTIKGAQTEAATRLRVADPVWVVPALCQHELLNVLWMYMRGDEMTLPQAIAVWDDCKAVIEGSGYEVPAHEILSLAQERNITAYDAQYVVLARELGVPLITEDKKLQSRCPDEARSMQEHIQLVGS